MNKFQELKEFVDKEYIKATTTLGYAYIGLIIVRNKIKELEDKEAVQSLSNAGY